MLNTTVHLIVEKFGFYMARYAELHEERRQIIPRFLAGGYENYLDGLVLDFENDLRDAKCAMSIAIVTSKPYGYADLEHDANFENGVPVRFNTDIA